MSSWCSCCCGGLRGCSETGSSPVSDRGRWIARGAWAVIWIVLLTVPLWLEEFWEQAGLFAMAAIIGAIGLTILTGTAGQLSLAHAFYVAVGAYGYCYFAGHEAGVAESVAGLGL